MTASVSTPMNFIGNALVNLIHDPAMEQVAPLAAGVATDIYKNTPANVFSNIPHFENEVNPSESGNVPGGESAA